MSSTGAADSAALVAGEREDAQRHEDQHRPRSPRDGQPHLEYEHELPGVDNPAFQDTSEVPVLHHNGVDGAAAVLGSPGALVDLRVDARSDDKGVAEAVNLELVNMNPGNGGLNGIPAKKEGGEDAAEGYADPYDEYFVPVNEHRKYMRGEKLYVTKDKRRSQSWGRMVLMGICCVVVAAAVVIGALAATGVILNQQEAIVGDAAITSRQFSGSASPVLESGAEDPPQEASSFSPPPPMSREPDFPPSTEMNQYYVPRVLDGEFVIDNMEFEPELGQQDSRQFQKLASSLEKELEKALFDYQSLHYGAADISTKVLQFSPGSVVVKFRIGWLFKAGLRNPPDPIQKDDVRRRLEEHLERHGGFLESYHLPPASIRAGYVIDMCQFNNGQCSNDCVFDRRSLDFACGCPPGQALDATGKNCSAENHVPENEIEEHEIRKGVIHTNTEVQSPEIRPHTELPIPEPQPGTDVPVSEPEPHTDAPAAEPQPITDLPAAEPQPITDMPAAEPEPVNNVPAAEPQPITDMPAAEPQPITEVPAVEPEPMKIVPVAEPQPITDMLAVEPQLITEVPAAEPEPITDMPAAEPEPVNNVPAAEPQPITEVPEAKPEPIKNLPIAEPQPITDVPAVEPQSITDVPAAESQPITDVPAAEPQPITDMPAAEPQPITEVPASDHEPMKNVPVAESKPITDMPTAELEPITDVPAAEPLPITDVPAAEPLPITDVPAAEPQPITDVPAAEPQPITDVPAAKPQPITDVPAAEPQPITDVPAAEPQPITDVPAVEPKSIIGVPAAEPQPITDVPAAEPQPITEDSLSKLLSSTELFETELGPSSDPSNIEGLSNTEIIQMGLQPMLTLQHKSNKSSEAELSPGTELPNEVPVGREFSQYHASVTEYRPALPVTPNELESETNNALHVLAHSESHTEHTQYNNSNSVTNNVDDFSSGINIIPEEETEVFGEHVNETDIQSTEHQNLLLTESNSSEMSISDQSMTTEELHSSENSTETHPHENELYMDYRTHSNHQNELADSSAHSRSEMPNLDVQEMTTNVMGNSEIINTTEELPGTTEILHFLGNVSEKVEHGREHEMLDSYHPMDPFFNITNEVDGRRKLSRVENEVTHGDVNTTPLVGTPDIREEHNISSEMFPTNDERTQLENNINKYNLDINDETLSNLGDILGHNESDNNSLRNQSENYFKSGNETAAKDIISSIQNNVTLLTGEDKNVLERKTHHEKDPSLQSMHTLVYGQDSDETLNDTNENETSTEFDENFRNIVEEPGFVLVNLTKVNNLSESVSATTNSNEVNEEPTEIHELESDGKNMSSGSANAKPTVDVLQNNATQSLDTTEDSENHIKENLASEKDAHNSTLKDNHSNSVSHEDNFKKRPRLDDDEMFMANPRENNRTEVIDEDETMSVWQPSGEMEHSNIVNDDVHNASEVLNPSKINETLIKDDKGVKDETGPPNDVLSEQINSGISHGLIDSRQNDFNTTNPEMTATRNENGVSSNGGANVSSQENDIDDIWNDHSNMTKQNSGNNATARLSSQIPMQQDFPAGVEEQEINASTSPKIPTSSSETLAADNDLLPISQPSEADQGLDKPLSVIPLETYQGNNSTDIHEGTIPFKVSNMTVNSVADNATELPGTVGIVPEENPHMLATNETRDTVLPTIYLANSNVTAATVPLKSPVESANITENRNTIASSGPESINIVFQPETLATGSDTNYGIVKEVTEPKVQGGGNFTSAGKSDDLRTFISEDLENKLVNHVDASHTTPSTKEHFVEVLRIPPTTDGNTIPPTSHGVSQLGGDSVMEDMASFNLSSSQSPIDETVLVDKVNSEVLIDKTEVKKKDLSNVNNSKKTTKATETNSSDDEGTSTGKLTNGIFDKKGKYDKDPNRKVERIAVLETNEEVLNSSNNSTSLLMTLTKAMTTEKIPEDQDALDVQDENENALHIISDPSEEINNVSEGNVKESKREKKKSDKTTIKEAVTEKALKTLVLNSKNSSTFDMANESVIPEREIPIIGQEFLENTSSNVSFERNNSHDVQDVKIHVSTSAKENVIDDQPSANGRLELLPGDGGLPENVVAQTLKVEGESPRQDGTSMNVAANSSGSDPPMEHPTESLLNDPVTSEVDDTPVRTVSTMPTITANDFTKLLAAVGISQMNGSTQDVASVTFSKCAAGQFQCANGTSREGAYCVGLSAKCDSVNDCSDGSDEVGCVGDGCPGNFQCASGQCLKRHLVCNGMTDCEDGSDEADCDQWKCLFDEFQCPSGRCIPVLWQCDGKPDCANHTDEYNCQSNCGNDEFLCPELWCIPLTWRCNGEPECANGEDEKLCDCALDQFKCDTGGCVPGSQVCDGVEHCPDSSDEWGCLKVKDDTNSLQIRSSDGAWHPVCGDRWDGNVSDLACRELGYSKAVFTDISPRPQDGAPAASYYALHHAGDLAPTGRQPSLLATLAASPECDSGSAVEISCQEFSCGIHSSADGMAARLVGGDRASGGQWPSVALMYHAGHRASCTASIVSPVWLLTSFNCLKSKDKALAPDTWAVFAGGSMFDEDKPERQIRKVQAIVPHPQAKFNQFVFNDDLALVRLADPLALTRYVSAVCLPEEEIEPRQLCVTAGWSYAAPGELNFTPYLNYLPIPTIELDVCNSTKHYSGYIGPSDICAGFLDARKSPCYNDEGAPLMCISEGGVWELQGVLSFHGNCGRGEHPAIFSSVRSSRGWIERTVGSRFQHKTAFNVRRR
ncbi:uncharacterized protein LOC134531825 isoform X2 [Bacillus rossius redtenbacheri]|uniref:uncharacterized protein LOC134531825 isoform X2 n=1 Tax=Bacillus rossius redtenbacheri TaxID=93214 RepID=UPI002FDEFE40